MSNISMSDILSANLAESRGTLTAKFKKTVNIRQYESETYELGAVIEVDYPLTSPERFLLSAILQAQVEYTVLCQLYYKKMVTSAEFVTRREELEMEVQGMKDKAEELTGKSLDEILCAGIKPTKRAENLMKSVEEAGGLEATQAQEGQGSNPGDQPQPEQAQAQQGQAPVEQPPVTQPQADQPQQTPPPPQTDQVQVTTGIPGMGPQTMFPGMGPSGIPGMGTMPNIPGMQFPGQQ